MEERLKQSGDQIDDQADSQFEADVAQAEVVEEITRPAPPVDDGISDLFSVTDDDIGAGEDLDDLTDVDFERDILDADDDGSIESLVSVDTQRDIMGVEPKRKVRKVRIVRPTYRPPPTGGMGTLRY